MPSRDKLKNFLKNEKLSVLKFAKQIGVHPNTIYFYLQGKTQPTYELAKIIQEYTAGEITCDDLITEKPSQPICPHCGNPMWRKRKTKTKSTDNSKNELVLNA